MKTECRVYIDTYLHNDKQTMFREKCANSVSLFRSGDLVASELLLELFKVEVIRGLFIVISS